MQRGRWIDDWEPDNEAFWEATGKRIARKNLVLSMFTEHIGFCVWVLWTIVVLNLADHGIVLSVSELFLLTLVPNLVGSVLRIPYTLAVPRFGGRAWTTVSAALLFVPTLLLAFLVPSEWLLHQSHDVQLWVLFLCAATAGVGGGNFSSSMANISFFYPERKKGFALGLNAAGGNLGVAVAQLLVPLVVALGLPRPRVDLARAGLMWLPLIALSAVAAWRYMDSLSQARADTSSYRVALHHGQTWLLSFLYIGTFGSFIGFSFALPLVVKTTFPDFLAAHPFIATYLAGLGFVGALVGSLSRPLGGWLADRVGGALVTFGVFVGMALASSVAVVGVRNRSFVVFLAAFVALFLLAGMGNGSTYKMIPSVFSVLGAQAGAAVEFKRRAAAVIGIAGAVGAFGGVLIQLVLRQASQAATGRPDWLVPALWFFIGSYVVFGMVTWFAYLRTGIATSRVPTLAEATL